MLLAAGVQRNHISTLGPVAVADLGLTVSGVRFLENLR